MTADLPLDQRRAVFATLVAKQEAGLGVLESPDPACEQFGVPARLVLAIEAEGLKSDRPPLDA